MTRLTRILMHYLVLLTLIALAGRSMQAQVLQGTLTGTVTDASGAVIPNATVKVLKPATGFSRQAVTSAGGTYLFNDLEPGSYNVSISAPSFGAFESQGTAVQANATIRVNAELKVGTEAQSVDVSSATVVLQTDKADTNYNLSQEQVAELPTTSSTGRNFQALYRLVPGATPTTEFNSAASNPQRSQYTNVNGVSSIANTTRIDGAVDQSPYLPINVSYVPPSDAIENVNIVTGSFNAEQGSSGGAAINVTIRSGTNRFHGTLFEYNGIAQFNARGFFQTPAVIARLPKYIFNQYGGSVGGPIIKNKLFFFADWESTHVSNAVSGFASVPTVAMRAGNFQGLSPIFDPATGTATGTGKVQFAGNQVPTNRISLPAQTLLAALPLPNVVTATPSNNYFGSTSNVFRRDNVDGKINYNPSDKTTIFGRYSFSPDKITDPQIFGTVPGGPTLDGGQPGSADGLVQNIGINATHLFTSNLLLDASAGFTRLRVSAQAPDIALGDYGSQVLKIPGANNNGQLLYAGLPCFTISNFTALGNCTGGNPFLFRDNQYTGNVNLSYTHGVHSLRFGAERIHSGINHFQVGQIPRGSFTFSGGLTSQSGSSSTYATSFADFLLGTATQIGKGIQTTNPNALRISEYAFYGQDTWQATHSLTISYGVRYELYPIPVQDHSGIYNFNPAISTTVTDALGTHKVGTVIIGGKGGNPSSAGVKNGWGQIVPRFGVAYRVGDRMVVRSGFGITIDSDNLRGLATAYPAAISFTNNGANGYVEGGDFTNGIPSFAVPDINAASIPLPYNLTTQAIPQDFRRGYIESYNLSVERQLPGSFLGTVAYVGNHSVRLQTSVNINPAPIGGGTVGRLLNATYGANYNNTDIFSALPFRGSVYNSLQAQLSRSGRKYGSTGITYTYSKAMNVGDNGVNNTLLFPYPAYWDKNWALAGYDRTNNFQWWTVVPFPFGEKGVFLKHGVGAALLGGFQLQTVTSWISGLPFTVLGDATPLNAPGNSQTANLLASKIEVYGAHHRNANGQILYFNPANFGSAGAVFGNSGRNNFRGPGAFQLDAGVKRSFHIYESVAAELQVEAFNLTNTPIFGNPTSNVTSATNGVITSASGSRKVRLSGRIRF